MENCVYDAVGNIAHGKRSAIYTPITAMKHAKT